MFRVSQSWGHTVWQISATPFKNYIQGVDTELSEDLGWGDYWSLVNGMMVGLMYNTAALFLLLWGKVSLCTLGWSEIHT